jgi:putative SOS response-associated peptidase YedK
MTKKNVKEDEDRRMPVKDMCGRFVLITDLSNIQKNFNIQDISCEYKPSWNIAPSQLIPAVINHGGINQLVCFRWGLIPSWSKDPSIANKLINARAETVDKKPSFRDAFKKRRCLIVADGFYEWKREGKSGAPPAGAGGSFPKRDIPRLAESIQPSAGAGGFLQRGKIPLYFNLKSGRPFGFAGLYETWISPDKKEINTCVIITTDANELIAPVHNRMPVILSTDEKSFWLDSNVVDVAGLLSILKPYPADEMDSKRGIGPHKESFQD